MTNEIPPPALAAHREALVEVHLAHRYEGTATSVICSCGWTWKQMYPDMGDLGFSAAAAEHIADAVLAYFADPAHGLTVETGAFRRVVRSILVDRASLDEHIEEYFDEVLDDIEAAHRRHPAHGLVRDEPSEYDAEPRPRHDEPVTLTDLLDEKERDDLARLTAYPNYETLVRTVQGILSARQRHDDGEGGR